MSIRTKTGGIPASDYTKEYFYSHEFYHSAGDYDQFIKGGKPAYVYLRALGYLDLSKKATYLDIGCGKGELVIQLARLGMSAIGIDYANAAIEICQDVLKKEKAVVKKLAQFRVANAAILPFRDESIDAAVLLDVIEHLTKAETETMLNEIKRVLKKGGKVIIHTNNKYFERGTKLCIALSYHGLNGLLHPKRLITTSSHPYEYMHINYVTPSWLSKRMRTLGFHTTTEYPKPKQKGEVHKYITYNEKWKRILYTNIGWMLFNSPLVMYFAPTFWMVGRRSSL